GKYDIKLVVGNKGCSDTAVLSDILKIEPPYISFDFIGTKCTGYPYYFINTSIEADTFCWKLNNQKKVCNKDTLIIKDSTDGWPIALWGKNFTSGCEDEAINLEVPEYRYIGFGATVGNCTPTNLIVQNFSQNFTSYKWNWGDGRKEDNSSKGIVRLYEKPGTYEVKLYASDKEGCIDSTKYKFSITGPHPDFEVFPKEGCGPHTVTLVNKTPSNNIKDQYWHISGVPPIAAIKDTTFYIFKKPGPLDGGAYAINLKATDNNGCINVKSDTVKVGGIAFDFEILEAVTKCRYPKITIQPIFKQQLDKKNLNYFWDVGDGRKFTGSIVDYFYDGPSLYTVSLKVVDENGCISQLDTVVKINEKDLKANFKADKLDANCPPLMVNFNSLSTPNNISKYEWDFGDGSYSKIANPTHIYLKSGKFTVKLKVWVGGCSDEIVYKDLVLINGPKGSFDFDKKEGCTPLEVNFTSTLYNTKKMEWDMGDGVILEDSTMPTYVYTRVGKYTPLMILADSFGCKYTLPPVGTIEVFPLPVPDFTNKNACPNTPVSFSNLSKPIKGTIKKSLWDFGDGDTVSLFEPSHIFKTYGTFNVKLNVWNSDGCEAEIVKQVVIKNIEAGFKPKKDFYCTGQIPSFINTSKSDTTFRLYHWFLNGELISKNINPVLPKLASGLYKVTLMVEDNNGCTDTFNKMNGLLIGDTFAPKPPFIYRVSVENDNSVALDFSGYRSFDFKHYTIYKSNNSKIATVNNLNDTSKIIGSLNTLHNVYCYKVTATNICGLESDIKLALEHCTVETKATGELKQVNVKWNAYKGWPVKMYEIFREDIAAKGKYDYLATVSGNQLNYTDTSVYCKMQHFYKIKAFENGGFNKMSWSDTTAARPKFENSVPPNNTIRATVDFDKEITIEWAGSGYPKIPIVKYILEKSEDGVHYKWYQSFRPDEFAYTDKKVLVDDKSYFYRTYAVDTCELRSPVTNFAKTILLKADTNVQERPFVTWSSYQGWTEGVIEYEVQCKQWDGTFVTIGFTSGHDSLFVDNLTDLNGYPYYCYRVIGYKNMINGKRQVFSISNEDCAPVRSRIFAANAFTINGDNINETFDIKGLYIRDYNIKIFTRWGELIFESNDMNVDWDGYYNGQLCQMDAYIWIIKAIGVDDVNWPLKGTVTIVR
ncbi:MAG: PKD domain-containing protein, partial [Bacteroidia bacterium]